MHFRQWSCRRHLGSLQANDVGYEKVAHVFIDTPTRASTDEKSQWHVS
jgi:hypothetical protein